MNVEQYARDYGLTDPYINKLKTANSFIEQSANQDRNAIQSQLNNQLGDFERYRQEQDQKATKDGQGAYVDYAKSINPFGADNESRFKLGLGDSGMAESSKIGANNSYQNRVTDVVNNRNKIFSDINTNISKAKETFNVEAAKIEKAKQERFLENLYKINDEFKADKLREQELTLARQSARRSYSGSDNSNPGQEFDLKDTSSNTSEIYQKILAATNMVKGKWQNSKSKNVAIENTKKSIYNALNGNQISREQGNELLKLMNYE